MASLGAVAGQVGLQLLLTPSTSNFVFKGSSLVLGTAYPIYASYALLESAAPPKQKEAEAAQWLTYWAVYGVLTAAEQLFTSRPPLYYHLKLALLSWMQTPKYQGAKRLYVLFLRPFLNNHRPQIESVLGFMSHFMARPEIAYFGNVIHGQIAKIPYLQWFVKPFDGRALP